jgi:hypothetical protein
MFKILIGVNVLAMGVIAVLIILDKEFSDIVVPLLLIGAMWWVAKGKVPTAG